MKYLFLLAGILFLWGCTHTMRQADAIYFNGRIVTMNDSMPEASVMVVKDGKIIAVGNEALLKLYDCKAETKIDLKLQYVYPGLIDAHCHFYGYAKNLMSCNLVGTKSWSEVLTRIDSFAAKASADWITGRGWDQNDWEDKKYPDNSALNTMFPDRPLILKRIDGHAAICNKKALDLAGIDSNTKVAGGEIVLDNNRLTGVLVDNAVDMVEKVITSASGEDIVKALKKAEKECYSLGLTTLADAGLDLRECQFLDSLSRSGDLSIYLYLMLNPTEQALKYAQANGIYENDHLKMGSFKLYADGALGSRGAKLKRDYCDREGHSGMLLNTMEFFNSFCGKVYNTTKYQVNTHCIGDSANTLILKTYGQFLKTRNDRRWRIEHAQIIDTSDIYLFRQYSVIPSVQPTHATSDAPWVEARICADRMAGAYAYKSLLAQNHYLALGTDFPVEYLNPLFTYYSAVFRENANNPAQLPFLLSERLTPEQAMKGMTIWAAKACMLEHRKGSLEVGKDADFIILDRDLLKAKKEDVLKTKIVHTYRMGNLVH
jgi:predicted amidohydrolase YtcJ